CTGFFISRETSKIGQHKENANKDKRNDRRSPRGGFVVVRQITRIPFYLTITGCVENIQI
ncbi:MAG: hypothetical protein KA524_07745, partial [Nitrosomonas sp.]|nr:hypothetical protein [Nitrosomonas sp.]MBP6075996.1 hypothetical protein [Nitrosomonas sp.]